MKNPEFEINQEVTATRNGVGGKGRIIRHKPGNHARQDWQVQHDNKAQVWYKAEQITPK